MLDFREEGKKLVLENDSVKLEFDTSSGFFDLYNKNTQNYVISNAFSSAKYNYLHIDTQEFTKLRWDVENIENEVGNGISVIIKFLSQSRIELNLLFEIYENQPFILIRNILINNSDNPISIVSLTPIVLSEMRFGRLNLGSSIKDWKILAGAYQSWSPVKLIKPFDKNFVPKSPDSIYPGKIVLLSNPQEKREKYEQVGDNYIVIKNLRTKENILFGFLTFNDQLCQVIFQFNKAKNALINLSTRCQADKIEIGPRQDIASELLMINFATPPLENLMLYGDIIQKLSKR